ncbi:MAG: UDP-N-acetylmuramoyl-L-alanine--D-glutamate ligase [Treponema sp.]
MYMNLDSIKNLKVTIMGLGLHGGGLMSAKFFAKYGANVTVTDLKPMEELKPSVVALNDLTNVRFVLGKHEIEDFENADLVIKNPIVKQCGNKYLEKAKWIESDVSVFLNLTKAPIIAITGTKGKSSTAKALHYGLVKLGFNAFLGGNIGHNPLSFLEETDENTPVVLELSSWQLRDLKECKAFKPHIAIVTPIMKDHQNWYSSMEEYVEDKSVIYKNQTSEDFLILNYDDEWGHKMSLTALSNIFWYSSKPINLKGCFLENDAGVLQLEDEKKLPLIAENVKVKGEKSKANLLNASLALFLLGNNIEKIINVMKDFEGLEHRMEFFFKDKNNVSFYNDSAATIPEATCAAISSFEKPAILITGGTDKALDFSPLAKQINKAKSIFLLKGSATNNLISLLDEMNIHYFGPYNNLDDLLYELKLNVANGDEVVFSPASSSFELFKNEFDRGNTFKQKVREIFSN